MDADDVGEGHHLTKLVEHSPIGGLGAAFVFESKRQRPPVGGGEG